MMQPRMGEWKSHPEPGGSKPRNIPDTPNFDFPLMSYWEATSADKTETPWPPYAVDEARAEAQRQMREGTHTCVKCGLQAVGPSPYVRFSATTNK